MSTRCRLDTVSSMRRSIIAAASLVLVVSACTTGTDDYKEQTEDFIEDDGEIEAGLGGDVSDAQCTAPESTDIDTVYGCIAQVEGIGEVRFTATIDGENSFLVSYRAGSGADDES